MTESRSADITVRFAAVTKAFGPVVAVQAVSFDIRKGDLVTLLGPSGCGKTTTLRMIAGLELPTSGQVFIGDREVTNLPATDRDVAMVFQSYALFPHMSVADNVGYGLKVSGRPKAEVTERATAALDLVGLAHLGDRLPSELSGGQQQRVAVARAVVLEPEVLLFDEPLSNLDAKLRRRVREEIRELQQRLGLTAVYVTHDQEEALAISDQIVVMNNAVIAQIGQPRELYEAPADRFVADFIGDANVVEVMIAKVADDMATVEIGNARRKLPHRGLAQGPAHLALRPEGLIVQDDPSSAAISGHIRRASYLGSHVEYDIDTRLGELFVTDGTVDRVRAIGDEVGLDFGTHGVTLVKS